MKSDYMKFDKEMGLRRLKGNGEGKVLVCFPFVGGQSLSFKLMAESLPEEWTVFGVDPPGHGWSRGGPLSDFDEMVDLYLKELSFIWKNRQLYLCGHSLGALIAFRLAQIMEQRAMRPQMLFLSAPPLPHRIFEYNYLSNKDKTQLLETLAEHGGIPAELMGNESFFDFYAVPIQADIRAFLGCKIGRSPGVNTPVYVFYSKGDTFLPFESIYEWVVYGRDVHFVEVSGNHLFLQSDGREVAEKIAVIANVQ